MYYQNYQNWMQITRVPIFPVLIWTSPATSYYCGLMTNHFRCYWVKAMCFILYRLGKNFHIFPFWGGRASLNHQMISVETQDRQQRSFQSISGLDYFGCSHRNRNSVRISECPLILIVHLIMKATGARWLCITSCLVLTLILLSRVCSLKTMFISNYSMCSIVDCSQYFVWL